jgi:hypothetical protein
MAKISETDTVPPTVTVEWQTVLGGPGDDQAEDVLPTPDGGFIVAGWTQRTYYTDRSPLLVKLDEHGDVVWQRAVMNGLDGNPLAMNVLDIEPTIDGYLAVGSSPELGPLTSPLLMVLKFDQDGEIPAYWCHSRWGEGGNATEGSMGFRDADGGHVIVGSHHGLTDTLAWISTEQKRVTRAS